MHGKGGHLTTEHVRRIGRVAFQFCNDALLKDGKVFKLPIKVSREQQHRAFQALTPAFDRVLLEALDRKSGADGDCHHQHEPSHNQPGERGSAQPVESSG